ncbi:MAG: hypothetical protein ACREEB_00830 [Caulobacteraceae bacterium]
MEPKELMARPILGFHIATNPQQPTLAVLMLHTETGLDAFAGYREVFEEIGQAMLEIAATLPRKTDLT